MQNKQDWFQSIQASWINNAEQLALSTPSGKLTFGQFSDYVAKISQKLFETGLRPGHVVLIDANSALTNIFSWASIKIGAISGHWERALINSSLNPDLLLTENEDLDIGVAKVLIDQRWLHEVAHAGNLHQPSLGEMGDLIRLVFSSGTTGTPKPIPLTLEQLIRRTDDAYRYWMSEEPFMCLLGPSTVSGFQTMFTQIRNAKTYIAPGKPDYNASSIRKFGIGSIKASPIQISELLDTANSPENLKTLKVVQSAGGFLPMALADRVSKSFSLRNLYGSSEGGTIAIREDHRIDPSVAGKVAEDVELEIADASGDPLPNGEIGNIRYKRPYMANSYFRMDSDSFKDGFFYPGDLGRVNKNGELELIGRASDVNNIGGLKINLSVVEQLVLAMDNVLDCGGFFVETSGEMTKFGLAFVLGKSTDLVDFQFKLRETLGDKMPSILMPLDSIPRNKLGKINRRELVSKYNLKQ